MKEEEIKGIYDQYHDMVFRIAFLYFKNEADACDVVQEVFIKLIKQKKCFNDEQHMKAWLMRVTANQCKSILRSFWRKYRSDEQFLHAIAEEHHKDSNLLYAIMKLPKEAGMLLYLHYYEGYKLDEIAKIMQRNASTIRSQTARAKTLLRKQLEKEERVCLQKTNKDYLNKFK